MVRESGRGRRRGSRDKGKVRRGREGPQTHSEQSGFCGYEILVFSKLTRIAKVCGSLAGAWKPIHAKGCKL